MTRERHELLKKMWKEIPFNSLEITDDENFWRWQGMTAALLSFNPQLQSDFRETIKRISAGGSGNLTFEKLGPECDRVCAILSEAINESGLAEEKPALILSDEHGIWWFINHCAWSVKIWLLIGIFSYSVAVFGAGLRAGLTNIARTVYAQWHNLPTPTPIPAPTQPQPNK